MLTIKNILVVTDFGAQSRAGLSYAFDVADKFDARVHLLHVFTLQDKSDAANWTKAQTEEHIVKARRDLDAAADAFRSTGRLGDILWHEGDPAPGILATASEREVDLIVIGASDRHGLSLAILGSVTETVVREAKTSVWVVRSPH